MPPSVKRTSKKGASAKQANARAVDTAVLDEHAVFGRVEKAYGNSMFQVAKTTGGLVKASVRGLFRRSPVRVSAGDYVILSDTDDKKVHEIVGVLARHTAARLEKLGRIPSGFVKGEVEDQLDDHFEFVEEEEVNVDAI